MQYYTFIITHTIEIKVTYLVEHILTTRKSKFANIVRYLVSLSSWLCAFKDIEKMRNVLSRCIYIKDEKHTCVLCDNKIMFLFFTLFYIACHPWQKACFKQILLSLKIQLLGCSKCKIILTTTVKLSWMFILSPRLRNASEIRNIDTVTSSVWFEFIQA